jgi:hypothetical protein
MPKRQALLKADPPANQTPRDDNAPFGVFYQPREQYRRAIATFGGTATQNSIRKLNTRRPYDRAALVAPPPGGVALAAYQ